MPWLLSLAACKSTFAPVRRTPFSVAKYHTIEQVPVLAHAESAVFSFARKDVICIHLVISTLIHYSLCAYFAHCSKRTSIWPVVHRDCWLCRCGRPTRRFWVK